MPVSRIVRDDYRIARDVWQPYYNIVRVVVHHTAGDPFEGVESLIARFPSWPYHWLIWPDGRFMSTAPPSQLLYHTSGKNYGSLSIGFVGDYTEMAPTKQSLDTFEALLKNAILHICPGLVVAPHSTYEDCECPGEGLVYALAERNLIT